jgi:hypothetical protein
VRGATRLAAMPGTNTLRALLALIAATAALSGCGSDEISGEIPAENAGELKAALAGVRSEIESSDCDAAASRADQFIDEVNLLPLDAGEELKTELRNAGINLQTLVDNQCAVTQPPPTQDTTTDTTTTTADTTSSTTDTTTTDTTTDTTTTDEQPPSGNGNGNGPPDGVPPGNGGPGGGTDGGTGGTGGGGTGSDTGD